MEARVTASRLQRYCTEVLLAVGLPAGPAELVSRCLVAADLRGVDSHGSRQVPRYARALAEGAIDPHAVAVVTRTTGATAVVDANHGMGQPAALLAAEVAIEIAARHGIAMVSVTQREGRTIPEDWATDSLGVPTSDPTEALAGHLLPAGGPKGYGLAVVNEVLAGALSGSPVLDAVPGDVFVSDTFDTSLDIGHCLMAVDPESFGETDAFRELEAELGLAIEASLTA